MIRPFFSPTQKKQQADGERERISQGSILRVQKETAELQLCVKPAER